MAGDDEKDSLLEKTRAEIAKMVRTHGAYQVTKVLAEICDKAREGMHEEAVIHMDSRILANTVAEMKQVHFLRTLQD